MEVGGKFQRGLLDELWGCGVYSLIEMRVRVMNVDETVYHDIIR